MTAADIQAIRDALAACQHKGAWLHRAKSNGLFTPPPEGTQYTYGTHLTQLGDDAEGSEDGEVIDFIVACHPERIARLLAALEDAQRSAAKWERYANHCEDLISAMKDAP